ncbi:MAG: hypothetical protein WDW38_003115 [Sanguina aurantia]
MPLRVRHKLIQTHGRLGSGVVSDSASSLTAALQQYAGRLRESEGTSPAGHAAAGCAASSRPPGQHTAATITVAGTLTPHPAAELVLDSQSIPPLPQSIQWHGHSRPPAHPTLPQSWPWRTQPAAQQLDPHGPSAAAGAVLVQEQRQQQQQQQQQGSAALLAHSRHLSAAASQQPCPSPRTRSTALREGFAALADSLQLASPAAAAAAAAAADADAAVESIGPPPPESTVSQPLTRRPAPKPQHPVVTAAEYAALTPDEQLHLDIQRATKATHLMNLTFNPGLRAFSPSHTAALLVRLSNFKGTPDSPLKTDSAAVAINRLLDNLESGTDSSSSSGGGGGGSGGGGYAQGVGYGRMTPAELVGVLQASSRMPWCVSGSRMQGMVQALLLERGRLLQAARPEDRAQLMTALARSHYTHMTSLNRLLGAVMASGSDMDTPQLSKVMWAVAKLQLSLGEDERLELAAHIPRALRQAGGKPQHLSLLAWACAKLNITVQRLRPPQNFAHVAWAFGTLDHQVPELMAGMSLAATPQLGRFNPQALSNYAWGCAKLGGMTPQLAHAVANAAQAIMLFQPRCEARHLVMLSGALAASPVPQTVFFTQLAQFILGDGSSSGGSRPFSHGDSRGGSSGSTGGGSTGGGSGGSGSGGSSNPRAGTQHASSLGRDSSQGSPADLTDSSYHDSFEMADDQPSRTGRSTPPSVNQRSSATAPTAVVGGGVGAADRELESSLDPDQAGNESSDGFDPAAATAVQPAAVAKPKQAMPPPAANMQLYELINLAAAFGEQKMLHKPLMSHIAETALQQMQSITPERLSKLLWACACVKLDHDVLYQKAAAEVMLRMRNFHPRQLAQTAAAYASLGFSNEGLQVAMIKSALRIRDDFDPNTAASMLHAFATAGRYSRHLNLTLGDLISEHPAALTADSLAQWAWSLSTFQLSTSPYVGAIAKELARRGVAECDKRQLLQLLSSLGKLGYVEETRAGSRSLVYGPLLTALQPHISGLGCKGLAMVARGLGTAQELRTERLVQEQSRQQSHRVLRRDRDDASPAAAAPPPPKRQVLEPALVSTEFLDDLWVASSAQLDQFDGKQLVDLTWGLSVSGFELTAAYERISRVASRHSKTLTAWGLARLAQALSTTGVIDGELWERIAKYSTKRLGLLEPDSLADLATAFAAAGVRYDGMFLAIAHKAKEWLRAPEHSSLAENLLRVRRACEVLEYDVTGVLPMTARRKVEVLDRPPRFDKHAATGSSTSGGWDDPPVLNSSTFGSRNWTEVRGGGAP